MPGPAERFLRDNIDNLSKQMVCTLCGKGSKKIMSHHIIPRYLSISSDEDIIEVCMSCHRKMDILWHNFLLWGDFKPVNWTNPDKNKFRIKAWSERNKDKIKGYLAKYSEKKKAERRALGVPEKPPRIRRRYEDLEIFKKQLSYLYWDKNLSWRDVSKEMKLSYSCVIKWVRLLGIPSRPRPISVHLAFERRKDAR